MLSLRRLVLNEHCRETLDGHKDLGNVLQKIRVYQIYGIMFLYSKSKFFFFVFTKTQTSIQHRPSRSNITIPLILGWLFLCWHEESNSPIQEGPHNLKEGWPSWKSVMFSEKLFCLDAPVRQHSICSFVTVIDYGASIILNRLPFI